MFFTLDLSAARQRTVVSALAALHIAIITASNYFVQLPITLFGLHTTWGAFTFPLVYVATDLTARLLGVAPARRVVRRVMLPALVLSYAISVLFHDGAFAGWAALGGFNLFVFRIALGSFIAYAVGQLLDILVFSRLRATLAGSRHWWVAPAASSVLGNLVDSVLFFSIAFYASTDPFMAAHWVEIALVDYAVKLIMAVLGILPLYGLLLAGLQRWLARSAVQAVAA
ncbi:7-cyano-7-deazaguanine/7-aminomethyl-7-deazaguanine transporter [Thiomonas sp.]